MRWIRDRAAWTLPVGLIGSCLVLVSALVFSRVPFHSRVAALGIRHAPHHVRMAILVSWLGLLLLVVAWWGLVRASTAVADGVRRARVAVVVWSLPLLVSPPLFSNDGWSYVATGYLGGHGHSPYVATPSLLDRALRSGVYPTWRHTTSPYGVLPLLWGALASKLTANPWLLLAANRLLAVVAVALLAVAVRMLAVRTGADPGRATALAVANPLVVVHGVGGLHNDMEVAALIALALVVTRPGRWWLGAVLVGLSAGFKVSGLPAAVGVVLLSLPVGVGLLPRVRRSLEVGVVAVGTLLLSSVVVGRVMGWGDGLGWVKGLHRTAQEKPHLALPALLAQHLQLGPQGKAAVLDGALLLVVVLAAVVMLRPRRDDASVVAATALVLLALAVLGPAFHYWYLLWSLPLLAAVRLPRGGERALIGLLSALGMVAALDPSLHKWWLSPLSLAAMTLMPLVAWVAGRSAPVGPQDADRRTLTRS